MDPIYQLVKGIILVRREKLSEGLACFDEAIKLCPENLYAWQNRGFTLQQMGRDSEAAFCFDKIIQMDPLNADAWRNKGEALMCLAEYSQAISCFDRAIEIDPMTPTVWDLKGFALQNLGETLEAQECFRKSNLAGKLKQYKVTKFRVSTVESQLKFFCPRCRKAVFVPYESRISKAYNSGKISFNRAKKDYLLTHYRHYHTEYHSATLQGLDDGLHHEDFKRKYSLQAKTLIKQDPISRHCDACGKTIDIGNRHCPECSVYLCWHCVTELVIRGHKHPPTCPFCDEELVE
jgi:tetratricopeptide (TPR) repeat protein